MSTRPKFRETTCLDGQWIVPPLQLNNANIFKPILSCRAYFPIEFFQAAFLTLVNHPEYNSSLILRSDTVWDDDLTIHDAGSENSNNPRPSQRCMLKDHIATRSIRRKLLPRRPGRDGSLEQDCIIYRSKYDSHPTVGVLVPQIPHNHGLPYYHPSVSHLAFRYVHSDTHTDAPEETTQYLIIEVIPLDDSPIDISSRLYRTCLALLETIDRYSWGSANNYKKRVIHDVIIPRDEYQDLYLIMKERYKGLVDVWQESTDPCKHVFEDVGIATFLMLLWKKTYEYVDPECFDAERPWTLWPRPSEGFVDLGCGNGILTHILISEGFKGEGIDLRSRHSWSHYPENTRRHLHVQAFNPFELPPQLKPSIFIIGNHADELTPWVPVVSSILPASGYLSIPCCPWDFDSKYERGRGGAFKVPQFDSKSHEHQEFVESLGFGEAQGETSYSKYRVWLAYLSRACGWKLECEMLRIPSTRNWAIIGRSRDGEELSGREVAQNILSAVSERGMFTPRIPEGKSR
ncbi:hypothetical protein Clacol_004581 [Clathrus columnatus]|uniref:tRNA (uracil-O(2)-)-methyltransferase n=1 Tax=Clathrus columnatus TaxID=1419009 RepID=A0AAV5ABQ6_9AGAM|nr:hypothetical protein Clacol_004581 [Clathrus columnatus]